MEVNWKVQDGYTNHGSHQVSVSDEALKKAHNPKEAMEVILDAVRAEFEKTVSPVLEFAPTVEAAVAALLQEKAEPEAKHAEPKHAKPEHAQKKTSWND